MTSQSDDRVDGASPSRLAIVGGGQLGMFLSQAAHALGIKPLIVTPDDLAPALATTDDAIYASFDSPGLAAQIAAAADVVTFELEDVPLSLLDELTELEAAGQIAVRPGAETLALLKNKARQKAWLAENDFPTLPFQVTDAPDAAGLVAEFGLPFVQKAQTGGYDGYGVQVIRDEAGLAKLWAVPSVIEPFLHMTHELAVVVARSVAGEVRAYPPVRMTFDHQLNILDMVVTPAGLGEQIDARASELACSVIERLQGVGIFAVEMFLDDSGALFVNEISPRVHNSGHVTLETAALSQFEQHVRAVCGLPLGAPDAVAHAGVMRNLLYTDDLKPWLSHTSGPTVFEEGDARVYWYGKRTARAGRKMGHITLLTGEPETAGSKLDKTIDLISKRFRGAAA